MNSLTTPLAQTRKILICVLTGLLLAASALLANANPVLKVQAKDSTKGVVASATGGGHYSISGVIDVKFSFSANQKDDGSAMGQFRQSLTFGGLAIDFHGEVICVTVDSANGRAWIGAVITQNNSEHPSYTTERTQPGKDIWFRVLDSGEGAGAEADRTTFLGFEGDAGIITSLEYCDAAIWPDDNARTSPVTQGNIQVRP
jgi:hypothetical protein